MPGLIGPPASNARTRWVASASASLSTAVMQSVGMTSNLHAGADYDSGGLRFHVAALRREKDLDFAGDID